MALCRWRPLPAPDKKPLGDRYSGPNFAVITSLRSKSARKKRFSFAVCLPSLASPSTLPQSTPSAGLTSICARTITQNHVHVCASAATMGSDKQPNTRGPGAPQLVFAPAGPRPHPRFMGSPSALPPPAPRARRRHLPPRREPPRDAGAQPAGGRSPWAGPRRDHTLPLPVGDPSRGGVRPT